MMKSIQSKTGTTISKQEFIDIVKKILRNKFYQNKLNSGKSNQLKGFMCGEILGQSDINSDNSEEFFIQIFGDRWMPATFLCYDYEQRQLLWKRKVNEQDNSPEIVFSNYSPCCQMPIEQCPTFIGSTCFSSLVLLDSSGRQKSVEDSLLVINSPVGYYHFRFQILETGNGLLFGLNSENDDTIKHLGLWDLRRNVTQYTNIPYNHLMHISAENNSIILVNRSENRIEKKILSNKLQVQKVIRQHAESEQRYYYNDVINIGRFSYSLLSYPNLIIDDDLQPKANLNLRLDRPQWLNNNIYTIKQHNRCSDLMKITFDRDLTINYTSILVTFLWIIIVVLIYITKIKLSHPFNSSKSSYFILYSIFEHFYFWKLKGKISKSLHLVSHFSKSIETPKKILSELNDTEEPLYEKRILGFIYKIYEIKSRDESEIIQRISHDMKNQVLIMKMLTDQYSEEIQEKNASYVKKLTDSLNNVSLSAQTLSKFSHIDKLYKEETEMNDFFETILLNYFSHPFFEHIDFQPSGLDTNILVDQNLLRLALDNLINNALDEIKSDQRIRIKIYEEKSQVQIEISNPINGNSPLKTELDEFAMIGYTTKPGGSGIGLPIAKVIIERHNGEFDFFINNGYFTVIISLPKGV